MGELIVNAMGMDYNPWLWGAIGLILVAVSVFWKKTPRLWGRGKPTESESIAAPYPWDFPIWDAVEYIMDDTAYGQGKQWAEIVDNLRTAAKNGHIRVWARRSPGKDYEKVQVKVFQNAWFLVQPSDPIGKIDLRNGRYLYAPRLSREEIESKFSSLVDTDNKTKPPKDKPQE